MVRRLGVVVIAAVVAGVLAMAPLAAQDGEGSSAAASTVRIQARLLESGKVEFGLQLDGERQWLPQARLFPYATAEVGSWLFASPYTVPATETTTPPPTTPTTAAAEEPPPPPEEEEVSETEGVYTPDNRQGGVEVWGAVPWDADFMAGYLEIGDFTEACGLWEREWGECDDPADMEILHQLLTEFSQCEIDRNTNTCVGFGGADQAIRDSVLACPRGWSISYIPEMCYHPEHPDYIERDRPY